MNETADTIVRVELGERSYYVAIGEGLLAETPLRASATSDGLVGWNIIWARALDVTLQGNGSQVSALELERPGDRPVVARRAG